jgi:hypothetical protein
MELLSESGQEVAIVSAEVYPDELIEKIVKLCEKKGIFMVCDDIYHKLTPETTVATHVKTVNWLTSTLPKYADRKVVVITHHAPSFMSISERYRGPGDFHMNGGYASELSELILDHPQIKVWGHGHVHSTHDYMIGTTRVLANPRGYAGHEQCAEDFTVQSFEV